MTTKTQSVKFPTIPVVAKTVRLLSNQVNGTTPVQLLISRVDGAWELIPGDLRVAGVHEHCFVGEGHVPGLNRQGRPHRFRSEDVARSLLAQAKEARAAASAGETVRGGGSPVLDFRVGEVVSFYGMPGRVVGAALVQTSAGPQRVILVESATPGFVPAWNLTLSVAAVPEAAVQHLPAPFSQYASHQTHQNARHAPQGGGWAHA